MMKSPLLLSLIAVLAAALSTSCPTMYDSTGRPVDVLTPEGAALAVVAAGVVGYALADEEPYRARSHGHHRRGSYHGYHGNHGYGGNHYRRGGYC
ncbi:MAG: hypothetical protein MK312_03455 [Roseibacillus sp.]|nr:hypothetical protein [Roseibacillus sp.]